MRKLKIIRFWVIAFYEIIINTIKGNEWNKITVDIHCGNYDDGHPKRKKIIAQKSIDKLEVFSLDLPRFDK